MIRKSAAAFATFTMFLVSISASAWAEARVDSSFDKNSGVVTLHFPAALTIKEERSARDLLLRFNQPLGELPLGSIQASAGSLLRALRQGYDSLLFVPGKNTKLEIERTGQSLVVRMTREIAGEQSAAFTAPQSVEPVDSGGESLSVQLAEVRLALQEGEEEKAFRLLDGMKAQYGSDPSYLITRASAERAAGRKFTALKLLEQARKAGDAPELESIRINQQRGVAPEASVQTDYRRAGSIWHQWIQRGDVEGIVTSEDKMPKVIVGARGEVNSYAFDQVRRANGALADTSGETARGELWARYITQDEHEVKVSVFGGEAGGGGGIEGKLLDSTGATIVSAEGNRPIWNFVGAVTDAGSRDQALVRRQQRYGARYHSDLGASVQRYNLDGHSDVASTVAFSGEVLGVTLLNGTPNLTLSYNLDAEYAIDRAELVDSANRGFNPLPFESREFHALNLGTTVPVGAASSLSLYGGYAYNRLGKSAPLAGASYRGRIARDLDVVGQAGTSFNASGAGSREDRFVFGLNWLLP